MSPDEPIDDTSRDDGATGTSSPVADARDRPIDIERYAWPTLELDPVERMRILAAGMPHVAADETIFDVGFDRLWSFISDFEHSTPRFESTVKRVRVLDRRDDRVVLDAKGPLGGPWLRFDVVLRPGWCLMSTHIGQVGMAARPEGADRSRFFHFEGSSLLGRIVRPLFAWNIRQDFRKLRGLL